MRLLENIFNIASGADFKTVPTRGLVYHRFLYSISGYSVCELTQLSIGLINDAQYYNHCFLGLHFTSIDNDYKYSCFFMA